MNRQSVHISVPKNPTGETTMQINSSIFFTKRLPDATTITLVVINEFFADTGSAEKIPATTQEEGHIFLDAVTFNECDLWPKYPPWRKVPEN